MLGNLHTRSAIFVAATLAGVSSLPSAAGAAVGGARPTVSHWAATWTVSPIQARPVDLAGVQPVWPGDLSPAGFANQTIRDIIWTSAGGRAARIRLSNTFGRRAITFDQVNVGVSATGASVAGKNHLVTFAGNRSITIAPGAEVVSDPIQMTVPAATDLAVSLFTRKATGPATYHSDAQQTNYVSTPGNHAASDSAAAFTTTSDSTYFLDEVDVQPDAQVKGTIVAFGDSITDGAYSTVDANHRWPNYLARRILAGPSGRLHPVVDEGISANRVLNDSACFGEAAQARFNRDVAERTDARYVVLFEGINDIGYSELPNNGCIDPNTDVSAAQIIAGYRHIITAAHAAGLKIFVGTITPFQGFSYYSAAAEAKRQVVNQWIRTSGAADGTFDFDAAVRDPANPLRLLPAYDSGDHLHPDDAGYKAIADAVDLDLFRQG